ncbi:YetF domain-containing protein [Virgibacillus sp. DJP39]|uniref:YetF domain-containing protein n=1 Tax=Virgibacillus sp. DJP39 TaxID=3409790 RepID=UPI003BB6F329
MNHYLSITVELIIGLVLLFIIAKSLGKTQFSQITPFDFISALILGELLGNAVYDHEVNILEIIFATSVWGILIFIIERITQKFKGSRKLLEGEPNIAIHQGEIKFEALKRAKIDINQLQSLIRQQGYFSIQEVAYAIIETNGMVSVLPKQEYNTPTNSDLNVVSQPPDLPITLILDGEVLYGNLAEAGMDEEWIKSQLANQNIMSYEDVLYAEHLPNKPLFVLKHEKKPG